MDELQLVLELLLAEGEVNKQFNGKTTINLQTLYEIVKNANKLRGNKDAEIKSFNKG